MLSRESEAVVEDDLCTSLSSTIDLTRQPVTQNTNISTSSGASIISETSGESATKTSSPKPVLIVGERPCKIRPEIPPRKLYNRPRDFV